MKGRRCVSVYGLLIKKKKVWQLCAQSAISGPLFSLAVFLDVSNIHNFSKVFFFSIKFQAEEAATDVQGRRGRRASPGYQFRQCYLQEMTKFAEVNEAGKQSQQVCMIG